MHAAMSARKQSRQPPQEKRRPRKSSSDLLKARRQVGHELFFAGQLRLLSKQPFPFVLNSWNYFPHLSCSTFAFIASSILMSGGHARLKPSPGIFFVASTPQAG